MMRHVSLLSMMALFATACGSSAATTCKTPSAPPSYATTVKSIVDAKCKTCHTSSTTRLQEVPTGTYYDTFAGISPNAALVQSQVESGLMPPAGQSQLSAAEKEAIVQWAACGAAQ